jgi:RNA polymerase sigma-70 factor (ECF subfamily)
MIVADHADAADVVHQVFASLLGRVGGDPLDLERYLRRAVRNGCYDVLRRRGRERSLDGQLLEPVAPPDDSELRLAVEQAIRTLPAEQREVLHLKVFEGMTFQQIADLTDEPLNTVASRYRYAIARMRGIL